MSSGVALVTGSGRRLGRQIAVSLAHSGFNIVVHYNESEEGAQQTLEAIKGVGVECVAVRADISDSKQVQTLVEKSLAKFHQIDVLVNNSGIFTRISWNEIDLPTWERFLGINLTGTFLCTQAVGRQMFQRGSGRIINIASIGGIQAWPKHIPYSVSKGGVVSLTRCFARALAPSVMVNAIAPGTVILEGEEDPNVNHIPVDKIPLKRYGAPRDITSLIVFLSKSATYITGQIFAVDGGRSIDFIST